MTYKEFIEKLAQDWNVVQKISPWEIEQAANRLFEFVAAQHRVHLTAAGVSDAGEKPESGGR